MAYSDTKARILAHAVTAGAAITADPILDVLIAFPVPRGRCARVYYGGEAEPARMGANRTLNSEIIAQVTWIALFLPVALNDEAVAAAVDGQLQTFAHALRTAIDGDSQLNGNAVDLELDLLEPDLVMYNNTRYLLGLWRCVSDYTEYAVAP